MKEVEEKDDSKDEKAEIPDASGGFFPEDGCFPIPIGGDYPPYPGLPRDPIDPVTGMPRNIEV